MPLSLAALVGYGPAMHYPVFLDLSGRRVLILGAGQVGRRKLASLLPCEPEHITLLDICPPTEALLPLLDGKRVHFRQLAKDGRVTEQYLHGVVLAFAVSGDRAANAHLARLCREANILCNVGDAPEEGNVQIPAHCRVGQITAAFSTDGLSPALARCIREEAEEWLGRRFTPLLTVMGRLRPLVLALEQGTERNTELFRTLVRSPLRDKLSAGDYPAAGLVLRELLPASLHPCIGDLLHEPL